MLDYRETVNHLDREGRLPELDHLDRKAFIEIISGADELADRVDELEELIAEMGERDS